MEMQRGVKEVHKGLPRIASILCADGGATAVEYAIMASLIAAVIVVVVGLIGVEVFEMFDSIPAF
jgi:Flp pilus assembly pilin Flp